jgi:hypothetical protein
MIDGDGLADVLPGRLSIAALPRVPAISRQTTGALRAGKESQFPVHFVLDVHLADSENRV